ncbi:M23 family metallopeptidase [Microbacterium sp. zg.B48]|uniref:M23 family metallopeptidase n=1 Tax=Microbacterium sp. zg.B48 TaxID=2969408 RepID=UPI00214CDA30|nr:M23 family metallopeptidase [Microbacterium sp. zg.B48]MCR2763151.1 M23 family metallopeptidase [Microbacterium sp. zg.B48]
MRPVVLELPFRGTWRAEMSPARRVPSHGTHLFGVTYAIDFVAVDARGRSAPPGWRAVLGSEEPATFRGFGQPVLAPAAGTVVSVHDGEPDHVGRRSPLTLLPYLLGQAARVRAGIGAIAGNHVVIALGPAGPFVTLVHLRLGSPQVEVGDVVAVGDSLAECGNSGNSTQPCVHVQVTDSMDWNRARGLPIVFRGYRSLTSGEVVGHGIPGESEIVEAL